MALAPCSEHLVDSTASDKNFQISCSLSDTPQSMASWAAQGHQRLDMTTQSAAHDSHHLLMVVPGRLPTSATSKMHANQEVLALSHGTTHRLPGRRGRIAAGECFGVLGPGGGGQTALPRNFKNVRWQPPMKVNLAWRRAPKTQRLSPSHLRIPSQSPLSVLRPTHGGQSHGRALQVGRPPGRPCPWKFSARHRILWLGG